MIKLNIKATNGGNLVENVVWNNRKMHYEGIIFGKFANTSISGMWDKTGKFMGVTPDIYDITIPKSVAEFMAKAEKTVKEEIKKRL